MPRPISVAASSRAFEKAYKKKSTEHQQAVDAALRQMAVDLNHPSLRARKVVGFPDVWEAHASRSVVMTFDFVDADSIRLRVCCNHDIYRNP